MKSTIHWLALIGLLAAPFGCMKAADATAAPGDYYAAEGGGEDYYRQDGATSGISLSGTNDVAREFSDTDTKFKSEAPPPPSIAEPEPEESKPQPVGEKVDEKNDDQPDAARHMVYTATLQLAVYELDEVIELAENIPERYGGWIQARYDYQITLRVPAARLEEVMTELSTHGVVLGKTLQASDVTAEYTDLESRIAVLEQLEEQLEILLAAAKTVEDSLKVRQELERVRLELESAKTRFRQLAELVGFSTLTLHLSQRGSDDALPSTNDPFPWVDELGVEATEYL